MSGRPNKYETNVKPRFSEIEKWLNLGATEKEVSKNLGVNKATFVEYKKKYPELDNLIKKSRKKPVEEIKAAMLKRAVGFQYETIKTIKEKTEYPMTVLDILKTVGVDIKKLEKPVLVRTETTQKMALPDPTAGLILLKHWDKKEEWTGDPATLKLRKEEWQTKKKQIENNIW